jgi:predicted Zn-dependent protease
MIVVFCAILLCGIAPAKASAQLGGLLGKKKADDSKPMDYSESDKQRLAKIEQMPEIREDIQKQWDDARTADLDAAYNINLTASWGTLAQGSPDDSPDRQRLYGDPVVQTYIDQLGQRLVPRDSTHVYVFRVLADPIPKALNLTTGTIYISTGMLSMLDNEAQVSYVLAHEIAHIEKQHAYMRIYNSTVNGELEREKAQKERVINDVVATGIGAGMAGLMFHGATPAGIATMMGIGGSIGYGIGSEVGKHFIHPHYLDPTVWEKQEEDEADQLGIRYTLDLGYDVRQVPLLFASLDQVAVKDPRVGLGFMADPSRLKQREAQVQQLLDGAMKAEIQRRASAQGFLPNNPEFTSMFASLKRDNGILAMQYDLLAEAEKNLQDATGLLPGDAAAQFYLAKVERLTAKAPEQREDARKHLDEAIRLDAGRGELPEAHFERASVLLEANKQADRPQIANELKTYAALYERDHGGLPGNMPTVYTLLNQVGDTSWYLPAHWYEATQLAGTTGATIAPEAVIRKAMTAAMPVAAPPPPSQAAAAAPAPTIHARVRTVAARKPVSSAEQDSK